MSKTKSAGSWHLAKEIAYERQGGLCGICNKPMSFRGCVGHHVRNKRFGGPSTPDNAECRHIWCEEKAHRMYKDGNPPIVGNCSDDQVKYRFRKKRKR